MYNGGRITPKDKIWMSPEGSTALFPLTTEWGQINGEVKYKGKLLYLNWLPSSSQVTALYSQHGNTITAQYSSALSYDSNKAGFGECDTVPTRHSPIFLNTVAVARLKMPSKTPAPIMIAVRCLKDSKWIQHVVKAGSESSRNGASEKTYFPREGNT